ncbi:MAG: hypothetical protein KAH95_10065 [Spirochaetales bacterium]|nr:hypothetical protein [Spirochaetales bacterium]
MNKELIGEHFVNLHDLSFEQAEKVLKVQKRNKKKKFGEIAIDLGFLESKKLNEYLDKSGLSTNS